METKEILKSLRKRAGYNSAQDFCNAVGISFNTYQNYESGKRVPTTEILCKLADFYGVTLDYIMGREPPPPPKDTMKILGIEKNVDDDKFLKLYNELPDYAKQIFVDTMARLSRAIELEKPKKKLKEQEQEGNKSD